MQVLSSLLQKNVLDELPIFHNLKVVQIEAFGSRGHLQVICQLIRHTPIGKNSEFHPHCMQMYPCLNAAGSVINYLAVNAEDV